MGSNKAENLEISPEMEEIKEEIGVSVRLQ